MARRRRKLTDEDRLRLEESRQRSARLLEVAERAEAALPPEKRRPPGVSNGEWMRQMLERAQAELDRRKQAEG